MYEIQIIREATIATFRKEQWIVLRLLYFNNSQAIGDWISIVLALGFTRILP